MIRDARLTEVFHGICRKKSDADLRKFMGALAFDVRIGWYEAGVKFVDNTDFFKACLDKDAATGWLTDNWEGWQSDFIFVPTEEEREAAKDAAVEAVIDKAQRPKRNREHQS